MCNTSTNTSERHLNFYHLKIIHFPPALLEKKVWLQHSLLKNNILFCFHPSLFVFSAALCNVQALVTVDVHLLILAHKAEHTCMLMERDCTTSWCGRTRRWGGVTEDQECRSVCLSSLPDWLAGISCWQIPAQSLIFAPTYSMWVWGFSLCLSVFYFSIALTRPSHFHNLSFSTCLRLLTIPASPCCLLHLFLFLDSISTSLSFLYGRLWHD